MDRDMYVTRFEEMVDALRAHHDVELVAHRVSPPASARTIRETQERLGTKFSESILDFYRQANGVQLLWRARGTPEFRQAPEEARAAFLTWNEVPPDPFQQGVVNVLPIERLNQLDGMDGMRNGALAFDLYSDEVFAVLDVDASTSAPPVLVANNYGVGFDFKPLEFWEYLEGILRVFGSYRGRDRHLLRTPNEPVSHGFEVSLESILSDCLPDQEDWERDEELRRKGSVRNWPSV